MKATTYQQAKKELKEIAKNAKIQFPKDKPAQRMIINDTVDFICKDYKFSEYKSDLLSLYACKLHPKN